jgi:hypothetical protein
VNNFRFLKRSILFVYFLRIAGQSGALGREKMEKNIGFGQAFRG